MPLFLRRPRQVALTEAGQRLAPAVTEAFALLSEAYAAVRSGRRGHAGHQHRCRPSPPTGWRGISARSRSRIPRSPCGSTRRAVWSISRREEVDVGIRSGGGKWPGLVVHMLFRADFTPMLSPKLAESIGGVKEPADLLRLPILDPSDPWWTQWFAAANVPADELGRRPGSSMGSQAYRRQRGDGRAGRGDPDAGAVCRRTCRRPPDPAVRPASANDGHAYWLVYPEARRNVPKIRAFREWLLAEIACSIGKPRAVAGPRAIRAESRRPPLLFNQLPRLSTPLLLRCSIEFGLT